MKRKEKKKKTVVIILKCQYRHITKKNTTFDYSKMYIYTLISDFIIVV